MIMLPVTVLFYGKEEVQAVRKERAVSSKY